MPADDELRLFDLPVSVRKPRGLRLRRAKDSSIELREFGAWTLSKLTVLKLYLKQYRRVAGNGSYIDGFAGQGSVAIADNADEQLGSARIAIEARAFRHLHLFEKDQATMADLRYNLGYHYPQRRRRGVHLYEGDFNDEIVRLLDEGLVLRDKPCFAFLDPNSTELAWSTVERLAGYKEPVAPPGTCKVELWILFNTHQAFGRLVDRQSSPTYELSGRAKALDRVMGSRDAWWQLYKDGAHINAFARRYADRLRDELGYGFAHPQLISDPTTGAPQYFMIHASDHPAAFDFMRWAKTQSCYFDNTEHLPGMA